MMQMTVLNILVPGVKALVPGVKSVVSVVRDRAAMRRRIRSATTVAGLDVIEDQCRNGAYGRVLAWFGFNVPSAAVAAELGARQAVLRARAVEAARKEIRDLRGDIGNALTLDALNAALARL